MFAEQPGPGSTLRLRRTFAAPPAQVYRAWTDPAALKQWWGPKGFTTPAAELDVRPGGSYRIAMRRPDGVVIHVTGTYREVRPPERLVFTWRWEGTDRDGMETLVTLEFHALGSGTELLLTHEGFPSTEMRDAHTHGWTSMLDRLLETEE